MVVLLIVMPLTFSATKMGGRRAFKNWMQARPLLPLPRPSNNDPGPSVRFVFAEEYESHSKAATKM